MLNSPARTTQPYKKQNETKRNKKTKEKSHPCEARLKEPKFVVGRQRAMQNVNALNSWVQQQQQQHARGIPRYICRTSDWTLDPSAHKSPYRNVLSILSLSLPCDFLSFFFLFFFFHSTMSSPFFILFSRGDVCRVDFSGGFACFWVDFSGVVGSKGLLGRRIVRFQLQTN